MEQTIASQLTEVWQRGPIPGIPALLQPVAHALLQAKEEVDTITSDFADSLIWQGPAGVASPAFHMQHLSGVLDRVFTYAKNEALTDGQLECLKLEGISNQPDVNIESLLSRFHTQINLRYINFKTQI